MVSESQKALAFATLVPGAAYAVGYGAYFATDVREFLKKAKRPDWVGDYEVPYLVADSLSIVGPIAAAYKVYKIGGFNDDDTKLALSLYAATFLIGGGFANYAMIQKSFPKSVWSVILYSGLSNATMLAMFAVDKKAGLMFFPLAFWSLVGVVMWVDMAHSNEHHN